MSRHHFFSLTPFVVFLFHSEIRNVNRKNLMDVEAVSLILYTYVEYVTSWKYRKKKKKKRLGTKPKGSFGMRNRGPFFARGEKSREQLLALLLTSLQVVQKSHARHIAPLSWWHMIVAPPT